MGLTWTEAKIQNLLASAFNKTGLCVPNCGVFGWEADLIRVTPRLLCAEYEVKISRADFRADSKSSVKRWRRITLENKHRLASYFKCTPNYFWYAAPEGVIPVDEVPPFAGLIEFVEPHRFETRKKAPRLHKMPLDTRDVLYITRGCALRYWQQRRSADAATAKD